MIWPDVKGRVRKAFLINLLTLRTYGPSYTFYKASNFVPVSSHQTSLLRFPDFTKICSKVVESRERGKNILQPYL